MPDDDFPDDPGAAQEARDRAELGAGDGAGADSAVPPQLSGPLPAAPVPPSATADPHDRTGLELARAVAAALRGNSSKRAAQRSRISRRSASAELSGAYPDARDPSALGAAVERLVAESGWTTDVAVHAVFARWPAIVGTDVAAHCTPESFTDGRLQVRTDSTAWATQLRLLAPTVLRRLNEELGHGTVVRIDVASPDGPSWRKGPRSVRDGRGPRDTYG